MENIIALIIKLFFAIINIGIIYFIIRRVINKARKENLSKIDITGSKEYYRELLKEYSSAELEYVDNLKVDSKRQIVSLLLSLELKGKIKINKSNIIIVDSNEEGLKKTEKYILKNIKNGKVYLPPINLISLYATQEAEEDILIIKAKNMKEKVKNKRKKLIIIAIMLITLFAVFCNNIEKLNDINNSTLNIIAIIVMIILGMGIFGLCILGPIILLIYTIIKANSYVRTEQGEELNRKLEGLKKYMKDFSSFEDKEKNELLIWDEYLIYSIIFNMNDKIVEEMSKFIQIEFKSGEIYISK